MRDGRVRLRSISRRASNGSQENFKNGELPKVLEPFRID